MSHQAVMRAVAAGRLQRSLVDVHGRPQIADVALADLEWEANTDLSRAPDDVKARAAAVATSLEPQPHGGALKRNRAEEEEIEPSEAQSLASASAREKHFRAKLAELKYRERAGELVEAREVQAALIEAITTCRTKLLGLPSKAKQVLPQLTHADIGVLDQIVREALEELVRGPFHIEALE